MGVCGSRRDENDRAVEKDLKTSKAAAEQDVKLLLLGAGGSGKSTIFKQLQRIHGNGFSEKDRLSFKFQIFDQIIRDMKSLILKCRELFQDNPEKHQRLVINSSLEKLAQIIENIDPGAMQMDHDIADIIIKLWDDEGIKHGYEMRAQFGVPDSSSYFFDSIARLSKMDYIPSDEDILNIRYRTTGMIEKKLEIGGDVITIIDVGGQRSERRKWIHQFDGVTGVIFISSLSCYNEVLFEDEGCNVMDESLQVFSETVNLNWFNSIPFIFFLNKKDLFEEKLKTIPLLVWDPNYNGSNDYDEALNYIKQTFLNSCTDDKKIYTHITCATDAGNIQKVFRDVKHIIIKKNLARNFMV